MHLTNTFAIFATISSTLAAPLTTRQSSDPQCINGFKKVFQPALFDIYIYKDVAPFPSGPTSTLNIMNGGSSGSEQQQVAQWTGIPATATSCTIGWAIAAKRAFSVYDNGLIKFEQMSGLPATNITVDTIKPFEVADAESGGMDFTFWPETPGPRVSIGGPVDCHPEVTIKLAKDVPNGGTGSVTLEQNAENGLYLSYNC